MDEPISDIIEAFGGRREAYRYLKDVERRFPTHTEGYVDGDVIQDVRDEVKSVYGDKGYELVFEKRERKMAGRAKAVTQDIEGKVLLVVGSAHFIEIVSQLQSGVEDVDIEEKRIRTGERVGANAGPWDGLIIAMCHGLPSFSDIISFFKRKQTK